MKKLIILFSGLIFAMTIYAQQSPLSESYFMDKYTLAPSYAGNFNPKFLFLGYRSDWSGINGGPMTFRLSFNDVLMQKAGWGARIVFDKAGIFNQLYAVGSYSYNLTVSDEHHILFGLSAGLYHNSVNLTDYYSDPNYNIDPALVQEDVASKVKFLSDASVVYLYKGFEAGVVLSNISFGDATYKKAEDIINIGAYVHGSNPAIDYSIRMMDRVNAYLRQDMSEKIDFAEAKEQLLALFEE